ncbi:MAG TPA: hypothetical protein VFB50_23875, partial [Chloroflexota bacterium]|nr:hypothetical protein [Chloroflexota bacterium]
QLSAALGLAVLGSISSGRTSQLVAQGVALETALIDGFHIAFVVAGVCVVAGLVAAQVWLRPPARKAQTIVPMEPERWRIDHAA